MSYEIYVEGTGVVLRECSDDTIDEIIGLYEVLKDIGISVSKREKTKQT